MRIASVLGALGITLAAAGCSARPRTSPSPKALASGEAVPSSEAPAIDAASHVFEPEHVARALPSSAVEADIAASNDFAFRLHARVSAKERNVVSSGSSVRMACGMVYFGADGDTATEMAAALGLSRDMAQAADLALRERTDWQPSAGADLAIANHLWLAPGLRSHPSYVTAVTRAYGATPEMLDVARAPEQVNGWVSRETGRKINALLDSIEPSTMALLANAVYFKGRWTVRFVGSETRAEAFRLAAGGSARVEMMHGRQYLRYAAVDGSQILEKGYGEDERMAMLFVLPPVNSDLGSIEQALTSTLLDSWVRRLVVHEVEVALPKFRIANVIELRQPLEALGLRRAFERAEFARIAPNARISRIVQKAMIDVDQEGTVAAAATVISMADPSSTTPPPARFVADRPFLFIVRDRQTRRVLFVGRLGDPRG